ncbi:MAG: hypothetical protein AAB317_00655 [Nitrospirota bacterium]
MKKIIAVFSFVLFTLFFPINTTPAVAASGSLGGVVQDSLYGGAIGTLLGTASLAFVDKESDHTSNIAKGAAIGVILGAIYGTMKVTGALAEVEGGKVTVGIPVIQIVSDTAYNNNLLWVVNVAKVSF